MKLSPVSLTQKTSEDNKLIKDLLFQSSIVKVIESIIFDPKKALYICFTSFDIITLFLIRVTQCDSNIPFNIQLFWRRNYHKIAHQN